MAEGSKKCVVAMFDLENFVRKQRIEILSDYVNPPLLLGAGGLRTFDYVDLVFLTAGIGPQGKFTPAGAMVEIDGAERYPADFLNGEDVVKTYEQRLYDPLSCSVLGSAVAPESAVSGRWIADQVWFDLAAGAHASSAIIGGEAGFVIELCVTDVNLSDLEDAAAVIELVTIFVASAGNLVGQFDPIEMTYVFDVVGSHLVGVPVEKHYPFGKRMITDTAGEDLELAVAGGNGTESYSCLYLYRYIPV